MSHLANAGCCIFFLLSWELRNIGTDDRPKLDPSVLENMSNTDFMESAIKIMEELQRKAKKSDVASSVSTN